MTGPFTAVFAQGDGKIIAYIEELPETYAEGATIEDARAALTVELALPLAANRRSTHESFVGARVVRRAVLTVEKAFVIDAFEAYKFGCKGSQAA